MSQQRVWTSHLAPASIAERAATLLERHGPGQRSMNPGPNGHSMAAAMTRNGLRILHRPALSWSFLGARFHRVGLLLVTQFTLHIGEILIETLGRDSRGDRYGLVVEEPHQGHHFDDRTPEGRCPRRPSLPRRPCSRSRRRLFRGRRVHLRPSRCSQTCSQGDAAGALRQLTLAVLPLRRCSYAAYLLPASRSPWQSRTPGSLRPQNLASIPRMFDTYAISPKHIA